VSGLWSAGPVGSAVLGLLALASAKLELMVALRCCCGAVVGSGSENPKAVGGSVFFLFKGPGDQERKMGILVFWGRVFYLWGDGGCRGVGERGS
jgi:hypothetical protein